MKLILSLTFILLSSQTVLAETPCNEAVDSGICVTVQNSKLECHNASSSEYLNTCTATIAYDVNNNSNHAVDTKISCTVELNYLQSVMGIRAIGQQRNGQLHNLPANTINRFAIPVEFKFSTQAEASNADIKTVSCLNEPT
ncbi:MAG TPA: hypothetical protein VK999_06105 [Methylotenera sp.]|nr:hypothetical protein [Methylotenera sp.]